MKKIIFILIISILIFGCSFSPTEIQAYQPILELETKDTLRFELSAGDDDVWDYGDQDDFDFELIINETNGIKAYITSIDYRIEDYDGRTRINDNHIFLEPIKIEKSSFDTMDLEITLNGHYVAELDENDGDEDFIAHGIIKITADFYDENNITYSSRTIYKDIIVTLP